MTFRSGDQTDQWLALGLVALGVAFRVAPHPGNFAPVTAIALFSGVTLPASLALTVPVLIMMASDLFLGLHGLWWLVWTAFLAVVALGLWAGRRPGVPRLFAGALAGSVLFFVVSNLGVFFFENMYPRTWSGLAECFTMALPFFRNTMLADLFYTAVLFSLYFAALFIRSRSLRS